MPKKKFDPNAPHTKAAFNPSGEYGTEQAQSQQTAPPESQGMKVSDLLTGPAYMVRHPIDSAKLLGGYMGGGEPETVNKTVSEGEIGNRFAAPGATNTPLAQGVSEAGAVASLGATSEIGAPRNLPVREGLRGAASKLKEKISRPTVTEQLTRPPSESVHTATPTNEAASPVVVADVPRPAQPGVPAGTMQSVPREQLPALIREGRPGAAEAHQAAGGRVLFRGAPEGFPERTGKVGLPPSDQWSQVAANAASEGADPKLVNRINQISEMNARAEQRINNAAASRTRPNASGESAASQEAINRVASEKAGGIKRFRIDTRSGNEIPLTGVDAVDARPGQYDVIVERSPKGETVLDSGPKSRPYRSKR